MNQEYQAKVEKFREEMVKKKGRKWKLKELREDVTLKLKHHRN